MARISNFTNEFADTIMGSAICSGNIEIPEYEKTKELFPAEVRYIEHVARGILYGFIERAGDWKFDLSDLRRTSKHHFYAILDEEINVLLKHEVSASSVIDSAVKKLCEEFAIHRFIAEACGVQTISIKEVIDIIDKAFIEHICYHIADEEEEEDEYI